MFVKLKLANGDKATVNTDRIEAIERSDDDDSAFEVHVCTRHYLIDAAEHAALLHMLTAQAITPPPTSQHRPLAPRKQKSKADLPLHISSAHASAGNRLDGPQLAAKMAHFLAAIHTLMPIR